MEEPITLEILKFMAKERAQVFPISHLYEKTDIKKEVLKAILSRRLSPEIYVNVHVGKTDPGLIDPDYCLPTITCSGINKDFR